MSFHFLFVFSITILVATIVPGPSMLLALTHGMRYGAKRTVASALGNLSITLLQAAVSIAGLGAVLLASQNLFNVIKWAGAGYLLYMGVGLWRSRDVNVTDKPVSPYQSEAAPGRLFLQGALVTAGNPKAIIFFTAVFPQFIDTKAAFIPQFAALMGIGSVIAFGCFMLYAAGGQKIIAVLSKKSIVKYINRTIGAAFIAAGIGLAVSKR